MANVLPYYPYYVNDFDDDPNVRAMNLAEVGLYQLALNEAWKQGSIPADPKELALSIRRKLAEVCKAWPKVQPCWIPNCLPGRLVNPRQEKERSRAIELTAREGEVSAKRSDAAKLSHLSSSKRFLQNPANAGIRASDSGSVYTSQSFSEDSLCVRVLFDDFLRRWARHRGFKKPNKAMQVRVEQRWQRIELSDAELDAAMDGYFDSEWGKREHYPLLGFLKDPHSWIADEARPPTIPIIEDGEGWESTTAKPEQAVLLRDFVSEWNTAVPAALTEWNTKRSPMSDLRKCANDSDFCSRFAEVCELAQKAHAIRGGDVSWITFEWIIREKDGRPGWWRLLTDLKGMAVPKPKTRAEQQEDIWARI